MNNNTDNSNNSVEKTKVETTTTTNNKKDNEVKLSTWKSVVALVFLFIIVCLSISALLTIKQYRDRPKGVLDIKAVQEEEEQKANKEIKAEDVFSSLNEDLKNAAFNYILDSYNNKLDISFGDYLKSLPNGKKLLLGDIADEKTFDDIKSTLITKFNSDLDVEAENLSVNHNEEKEVLYLYNKEKNSFFINSDNQDLTIKIFNYQGSIIDYEYDKSIKNEDGTVSITSHSLFEINDDEKVSINNLDKSIPLENDDIDECKKILEDEYEDKKEFYNKITYTFEENNDKYYIKDIEFE